MTVRSALRAPIRAAVRAPIVLRKPWTPAALFSDGQSLVFHFVDGRYAAKSLVDGSIDYSATPSDLMTVQRASPKWVYDETGTLVEVPVDTLAIQHDPLTGASQGALIEESRTNLLLRSEDLTNAAWGKYAESSWEFSVSTKPSPIDGVNFSRFFVPQDVTSETTLYHQTLATTVGTGCVFSFIVSKDYNLMRYCQIDGMSGSRTVFDIDTGTFESISAVHTAGATDLGDSWLVWVSFVAESERARVGNMPQESASVGYNKSFTAGGYQYTTGFQFEESSTPSSYTPTTDSPVTRAADTVTRSLGDEYDPNAGTYTIRAAVPSGNPVATLGSVSVTSASDEMTTYTLSYSSDPGATGLVLGNGLFDSIEYTPGVS